MKHPCRQSLLWICTGVLMLLYSCQQHTIQPHMKSEFDTKIDTLVLETLGACRGKAAALAPAAVVPYNALKGKKYTRLDELISQRLSNRLAADREVIELSRENWFELKESKPLSFKGHSNAHADLMANLIIFFVHVEPEPLFDQIKIAITARDSNTRPVPGIRAQALPDHFKDSPATLLLKTPPGSNPAPQGLKQNPYNAMEHMAYSLASELSYAMDRGVKTGAYKAADDEIQVMLCPGNFQNNTRFNRALAKALQQALASMDDMTCAVSREDLTPVFNQMNFYQNNSQIFEMDNEKFKPGSVLLMTDIQTQDNVNHVALRAIWRVTPLKDKAGGFIPDNTAGTYVSGFTSRAWFRGHLPQVFESPAPGEQIKKSTEKGFD